MKYQNKARILRKSIRYPTYQLSAMVANTKETPENQLKICALTVLEWIRTKFQDFDIPADFQMPAPADYLTISLDNLKSSHIDEGYTVETVSIPQERIWAFRLIEPDLSTKWINGKEISTAIPGRILETNIGFRVVGCRLYCSACTTVTDPEHLDEAALAETYCPTVILQLIHNNKIGLRSGYPLEKNIWPLNNRESLKNLNTYLRDGMLPAVVFCDYEEPQNTPEFSLTGDMLADMAALPQLPKLQPLQKKEIKAIIPYDVDLFTSARMAYVHSFHLQKNQINDFSKQFHITPKPGDVLLIATKMAGGGVERFPYCKEKQKEVFSQIMKSSQNHLRKKEMEFEHTLFLSEAKKLLMDQYRAAHHNVEETITIYEDSLEKARQVHKEDIQKKNNVIEDQERKIKQLKQDVDTCNQRVKQAVIAADEKVAKIQRQMDAMQDQLNYFKGLDCRPRTPQEIPTWVEKSFHGHLEFHSRAVRLIEAVAPNQVDMRLLCDAIEYLATEYLSFLTNQLTWEEGQAQCAAKYGRSFEITGCGDTNLTMYANQYSIKYKLGFKGKPIQTPLDRHLKVGNTAGNLIRIYFLFDDVCKKIVVGSLPEHLPTSRIEA